MNIELIFEGTYTPPLGNQIEIVFGGGAESTAPIVGYAAATGAGGVIASAAIIRAGGAIAMGTAAAVGAGDRFPRVWSGPAAVLGMSHGRGRQAGRALSIRSGIPARVEKSLGMGARAGAQISGAVELASRAPLPREAVTRAKWGGGVAKSTQARAAWHGRLESASCESSGRWAWGRQVSADVGAAYRRLQSVGADVGAAHRWGVPVGAVLAMGNRPGVPVLFAGLHRWGRGVPPPPGRRVRPIAPPAIPPDYVPPLGGDVELLFCEPAPTGPLILMFRKVRCPQIAERIVPIRRIYIVWDSASLIRLSDGQRIPITSLNVSTNHDSWLWKLGATLGSAADVELFQNPNDDPVEVRAIINGHEFDFVLDNEPDTSESVGNNAEPNNSGSIVGYSLAAYLDEPYAPVGTWLNSEQRNAQQLAGDVLPFGWALDWSCQDWPVSAGAWSHRGTPASALKRLAEAAGGVLASARAGAGVAITPRYPVLPWLWGEATPWALIPRAYCASRSAKGQRAAGHNVVWVVGERGGLIGRVLRAGSAGDREAAQIVDALATHPDMIRQRAGVVLAQAGRRETVGLSLPVGEDLGIVLPGKLLAVDDIGGVWRGLSRGVQIGARVAGDGAADVMQSIQVERWLGEATGRYAGSQPSKYNPWAYLRALTAGEPRLGGTVTAHHSDGSSTVELLGGGVVRVRGTEVAVGQRAFVQGGKLDGPLIGTLVEDTDV